jgi:glycine cleavage system H protein
MVRVGMDDFASKLVGKIENIACRSEDAGFARARRSGRSSATANPWTWFRQSKAPSRPSMKPSRKIPNSRAKILTAKAGCVTVQAPDSKINFRNLLGGTLARLWTESAALQLRNKMPMLAGALAQDGGVAVDDLTAHMPGEDWATMTKEFFLS